MHIAFCIALPHSFAIGLTLRNSPRGPLSRSIVTVPGSHRRRQHRSHVMMMTNEQPDKKTMMIHRYDSPFIPINEDREQDDVLPASSALVILNTPINYNSSCGSNDATLPRGRNNNGTALSGVLGALWKKSTYRVCADGGANRLYEATVVGTKTRPEGDGEEGVDESTGSCCCCEQFLPDLVTGDLDSLYPHVHEYYKSRGVDIVRVEDQDFHDLDKSLMAIENWIVKKKKRNNSNAGYMKQSRIFVYGGFGGRFDQEMAVINALCVWGKKESFRQTTLAVYDEQTCAFLLSASPATNHIRIRYPGRDLDKTNQSARLGEGPTCGLIPIFGRCEKVFTTGLQWNLNGEVPIEFGGLVSSSNRVIDDVVVVETSSPMLFTAEIISSDEVE